MDQQLAPFLLDAKRLDIILRTQGYKHKVKQMLMQLTLIENFL